MVRRVRRATACWPAGARLASLGSAVAVVWAIVALLFSAQGYAVSAYQGTPQPWWPSLAYSLAIFSVWALLTAPIALAVRYAERAFPLPRRIALYAIGLVVAAVLHVGLFSVLYWPFYSDNGRIATRWAMGERMFVANFDTNTLFYFVVVSVVSGHALYERRSCELRGALSKAGERPARSAGADLVIS